MAGLAGNAGDALEQFHSSVEQRTRLIGGPTASLQMLKHQLQTFKATFKDIATSAREEIIAMQKDINREFVPVVAKAMNAAYSGCVAETGAGSFMRMKALMAEHVGREKDEMFKDSTQVVRVQLNKMVNTVEENMLTKADTVFLSIKRDYTAAVVGGNSIAIDNIPWVERSMKSEVLEIVESSESIFKQAFGIAVEEMTDAIDGDEAMADVGISEDVDDSEQVNKPVVEGTLQFVKIEHDENQQNNDIPNECETAIKADQVSPPRDSNSLNNRPMSLPTNETTIQFNDAAESNEHEHASSITASQVTEEERLSPPFNHPTSSFQDTNNNIEKGDIESVNAEN